jgi:hypothetical protein
MYSPLGKALHPGNVIKIRGAQKQAMAKSDGKRALRHFISECIEESGNPNKQI